MEYVIKKEASELINKSKYIVNNPSEYKNKWDSFFNNKNEIHLELGMGRGEFIINMAKKYPNINFVGLELNENQIAYACERLNNINLPNLKLICADATLIDNFFSKEIDTIYLTFSEPWPKRHDEKKRFTSIYYLKLYDKIFKKDKHIILKTDNKILFQYSLEILSSYWYEFKKVSLDLHNDEREIDTIPTDWELKCIKDKKEIYYLDAYFKE